MCNFLVEFSFNNGRFIALSPKTYHSFNADTRQIKSGHKGIHHSEAKKLTIETFADCLYNEKEVNVMSRELRRNKNQQMTYYEKPKRGLNSVFKKFPVQDDQISCLPLSKNGKIM